MYKTLAVQICAFETHCYWYITDPWHNCFDCCFFFFVCFVISKATFLLSWSSGCWWRWQLQPWASRDFLSEPSQCPLGQNPPTESPSPLPGVCEGAVPQYSAPGGDWERPKGSQDRKHNLCWPAGRQVSLFQHRTLFSFIAVGTLSIVWTTVLLYLTNDCKFRKKKRRRQFLKILNHFF